MAGVKLYGRGRGRSTRRLASRRWTAGPSVVQRRAAEQHQAVGRECDYCPTIMTMMELKMMWAHDAAERGRGGLVGGQRRGRAMQHIHARGL